MKSITMLIAGITLGATYGYIFGNPYTRDMAMKQMQKFSGTVVESLSKQGDENVQDTEAPTEQPEN